MNRAAEAPDAGGPGDDVGALVQCCAEATLAHIDASVDELGQAGALLGDAMAALRGRFAAALAADPGECRHHLEAAMVALQCEDALLQMLESMRRRSLRAADALRGVASAGRAAPEAATTPGDDRAVRAETASRLRLAVTALNAGAARPGPVRQKQAVAGTVDLF